MSAWSPAVVVSVTAIALMAAAPAPAADGTTTTDPVALKSQSRSASPLPSPPSSPPSPPPAPDPVTTETRWGQLAAGCGTCVGGGLAAGLVTMTLTPVFLTPAVTSVTRDALQIGSPCNNITIGFCTGAVLFTGAAAGTGAVMAAVEHEAHLDVDVTTTVLAPAAVAVVGAIVVGGATFALSGRNNYDLFVLVPVATLGAIVTSPLVIWSASLAYDRALAEATAMTTTPTTTTPTTTTPTTTTPTTTTSMTAIARPKDEG